MVLLILSIANLDKFLKRMSDVLRNFISAMVSNLKRESNHMWFMHCRVYSRMCDSTLFFNLRTIYSMVIYSQKQIIIALFNLSRNDAVICSMAAPVFRLLITETVIGNANLTSINDRADGRKNLGRLFRWNTLLLSNIKSFICGRYFLVYNNVKFQGLYSEFFISRV